jgi:RHS repeat-associated protein
MAGERDRSRALRLVGYPLDDIGNRTQRVDQQGTHDYEYDDLYRLTEVTYPGPATTTYAFDAFGNRTSMTVGTDETTYTYDDADRLTEVDGPATSPVAYTWDDNGSLTARGSDSFAWDYEERMTSATVNSVTTTFAYRGDGLRDSRTTGANTTTFTWDIAAGLPVVIDDGNRYVYGAGLEAMDTGSDAYYYLADGLGSTMKTVDASGNVVNSYTYDVYGKKTTSSGSQSNEFDFAGQQTDPTGLQYLRARYMDPETGTFASRDPLSALASYIGNPFGYSSANPAMVSDPTGLCGYYGDPADPWCKEQKPPEDNVNDEWRRAHQKENDDHEAKVWTALKGLATGLLAGFKVTGEAEIMRANAARTQGEFVRAFLLAGDWCATDQVCSLTVSYALRLTSYVPWIGPWFRTLSEAWDAYSTARQGLPGVYPNPPPGQSVPASPDRMVGEGPC